LHRLLSFDDVSNSASPSLAYIVLYARRLYPSHCSQSLLIDHGPLNFIHHQMVDTKEET